MKPKGLFLYPNYLFDNPTSNQFERTLLALDGSCERHLLTRPGPMEQKRKAVDTLTVIPGCGRIPNYVGEVIKSHLGGAIPDEMKWSTNPQMVAAAARSIRKNGGYDFIVTMSFPLSCHLAGYALKRRFGIPWMALFYDPWTDNTHRPSMTRQQVRRDRRWERAVAEEADAVVHTNETMERIWAERYGKSSVYTLPFCYTKEMMDHPESLPQRGDGSVSILYSGLRNQQRNISDLVRAVSELKKEDYPCLKKMKINVVGPPFDPDRELVRALGVEDSFNFAGNQSKEQLPAFFRMADLFVVVDGVQQQNVFFPSKLMDYFYYRRPILGITPPEGCTASLLRDSGNCSIPNGDIHALTGFLKRILEEGCGILPFNADYYRRFSPEVISGDFMQIVHSIL